MGNKSSKADFDNNNQRNGKQKKKGNPKLDRAFSDSDIPSMRQKNPNRNNNARPQSSMPGFEGESKTLPDKHKQQTDALERDKVSKRFNHSLQDLLRIWPEYSALNRIDIGTIVLEGIETMQKVFTRITEQHEYFRTMSREKQDLHIEVDELKEETLSQKQRIKEYENSLEKYADDVAILKGELKRRGIDPKVPNRSPPEAVVENEKWHEHSDGSDNLSDSQHAQQTKERFAKMGYMPTPIVQMSHNQDVSKVENLIKRSASMRKGGQDENRLVDELNEKLRRLNLELEKAKADRDTYHTKLDDLLADVNNVRRTDVYDGRDRENWDSGELRRLQNELDREQKANQQLKDRLDNLGNKPRFAVDRKTVVDSIVQSYEDLKAQATGHRLEEAFEKSVGRVSVERRSQFICAIMEESYAQAGKLVRTMMTSIKELLADPTPSNNNHTKAIRGHPASAGPLVNRQRNFSFNRGTAQRSSSNATRPSVIGAEVPRELMQDIGDYVESIAENFEPSSMAEAVIDILSREFRECITPALMNHNQFSTFLHNCCALAWRMCIAAPPLYLVSTINDPDTTVDRKLHDISSVNIERTVNQIDYYLWPALYTRKNGMVLVRGMVVLQKA